MEKTKGFFFHLSVNPTLCSVVSLDCAYLKSAFPFQTYNRIGLIYVDQDYSRQVTPDKTRCYSSATMFCLAKPITLQSFPENKSILTIMVQPHNDKRHIVYMCINACIVVVYSGG